LRVSAPRDRMCICNTAHTRHAKCSRLGSPPRHPASASRPRNELRARSPLTVCQPDFSHAKNYPSEMHTCAVVKCDKCELWCVLGDQSESFTWLHSHSLCQNSSPAFLAAFGWFVACFTVLPSETRSVRLSGACNDALW
jgi:hypothetical protein